MRYLVFIIAAAVLIFVLPPVGLVQMDTPQPTILPALPEVPKTGNPKIEYALTELLEIRLSRGPESMKSHAALRDIEMSGDMVRVVVEAKEPAGPRGTATAAALLPVQNRLESLGGRMETQYENLVQGLIRIEQIESLADTPHVRFVRLPFKAFPQEVLSEGVNTIKATGWKALSPYRTSEEVKICILDAGFTGYSALLGTELPASVVTRSFRADGNLLANKHGTGCAEIVYDMVPNAKLYLANFGTDVEHGRAVDWIIEQGIHIVSYSMGWYNAGRGDGTGPIGAHVKKAADAGVVWVSAAGNSAEKHWKGTFSDTNGNGWHNFTADNEVLNFWVPAYNVTGAWLRWDNWGNWSGTSYSGSNQDYDLYLWVWTGSSWMSVASSKGRQTGSQWPTEAISGWYSTASRYWGISIQRYSASQAVNFNLLTTGSSQPIQFNDPWNSLLIPADSPHVITVGATDWNTDAYHVYSSRGPTNDGRVKPDFSAPAGTSGVTYGTRSFFGTSASTPHMAGAFGLILEKTPFTAAQVRALLENRARDLGSAGKDNQFGVGRVQLIK
jgi:hypothetical protein